ncbi:MAG: hypothetical protein EA427_03125 [Spirochaetaceae bacterium]|nr:MAG: hypothetical protein EA427_03125 [Spirochaetaceae bacterium]
MRCEKATRRLLLLDHNERPDRLTAKHLERCSRCRTEYEHQRMLMSSLAGDGISPDGRGDSIQTEHIMALVRARASERARANEIAPAPGERPERESTLGDYLAWIGAGLLIVTGLVTLPWNPVLQYLHHQTEGSIVLSTGIITGLVISLYLGVFIATHLEDLSRSVRGGYRAPACPASSDTPEST